MLSLLLVTAGGREREGEGEGGREREGERETVKVKNSRDGYSKDVRGGN